MKIINTPKCGVTAKSNASGCTSGAQTYTAGLKWILNPNVQFKLNYMHTNFNNAWQHYDVAGTGVPYINKENMLMFRTQYAF